MILDQLQVKFGGMAQATGQTLPMALARLKNAIVDGIGNAAQSVMPTLTNMANGFITNVVPAVERAGKSFIAMAQPILSVAVPAIKRIVADVINFATTMYSVLMPIIKTVINVVMIPAWKATSDIIKVVSTVLEKLTGFVKDHKEGVKTLAGVVLGLVAAYKAMMILGTIITLIKDGTLALKVMYAWDVLVAAVNPFGWAQLAVMALAALVVGVVYAYNHFKVFHDVVAAVVNGIIGFFQMLANAGIKVMNVLIRAWNVIPWHKDIKLLSDVELPHLATSAENAAKRIKAAIDAASYAHPSRGKIKGSGVVANPIPKSILPADLSSTGASKYNSAAAKLKQAVEDQKKTLADFAYYFKHDFIGAVTDGTTSASSIVSALLGNVDKAVKGFTATIKDPATADKFTLGATKITNSLNDKLLGYQTSLDAVNKARKDLTTQISTAQNALDQAKALRTTAAAGIFNLLQQPLGSPSELHKALADSSATADSIVVGYKNMVKLVQDRFDSITGGQQDSLLTFLKTSSERLLVLVKKREDLVQPLKDAQTALAKAVTDKQSYGDGLSKALGDANMSMSEFVSKEGLVSSPAAMIESFKSRLQTVKNFQSNVQSLAARGVKQTIIDQILGMGSGNGGALASSLNTASADQIAALNDAAGQIQSTASSLGSSLSTTFYDTGINAAQKAVDAIVSKQSDIQNQMDAITTNIGNALRPLTNNLAVIGADAAQALLDSLTHKQDVLIAKAAEIGAKMAQAVAAAFTSLNVLSGGANFAAVVTAAKAASARASDLAVPPPPPRPVIGSRNVGTFQMNGDIHVPIQVSGNPDPTQIKAIGDQVTSAVSQALKAAAINAGAMRSL